MAFIHKSGPAHTQKFKKKASTAIAVNSVLSFDGTLGQVLQAEAASTRIAGICLKKIASTDSDYASAVDMSVLVPTEEDIFEVDVTTGTATAANVGDQFDLDTNSAGTAQGITVSGTNYKVVTCVGFISASKLLVTINGAYQYANKAN